MPFHYKYKQALLTIDMDPRKLQIMIAANLLLIAIRLLLIPVLMTLMDQGTRNWFAVTGNNVISIIVFAFTVVTSALLILDAKKG